MKYEMKHAVFEEMFQATDGQMLEGVDAWTAAAHQHNTIALVLPFYMYCFHPHDWQNHTLFTVDPLSPTLNHATHMALDAPTLHANQHIKRFFYGAAAISSLPVHRFTAMTVEDWTYYLFRQYYYLQERTHFFENRVDVKSVHPGEWLGHIIK